MIDLWLRSKRTGKLQDGQVGFLTEDKGCDIPQRDQCNDKENAGRIFILHGRNGWMEFDFLILYNI
jgi:hypothetical protein